MKKIVRNASTSFFFAFLFISCAKEPSSTVASSRTSKTDNTPKTNNTNDATQNRIVSFCGRKFNYVEPPAGTWALAIKVDNVVKKIGVPGVGEVSFTSIDWVKFEFSGQYADAANTIKLYRIRRTTDNKCLTYQISLTYSEVQADLTTLQLWAFEGMSDNSYRFTPAKYNSTNCIFAFTYPSNGEYRIGCTYLANASSITNFSFFLSPVFSLPPNTD